MIRSKRFLAFSCSIMITFALTAANAATVDWKQTRAIKAPEAFQAAAAQGRYVYAIASRSIAKYDRESGEPKALSKGKATHLNSGLFWNGRLYCAHTNHPFKSERNRIMVLDPETMRLSVYKDFGDSGGSLTWAIRRDGHWWCNFAHYKDENHKTFFVKYDSQWNELARWTYPAEVIGKLEGYSLSGGVWMGDDLLVTGHDEPILFRLRLPERGQVLEYIDEHVAPFSGQGIALDPVTGGLIGIHRANRQIVFAETGFVSMFDGRSLKGWTATPAEGEGAWTVKDGVIVGVGEKSRGHLTYEKREIADFELRFSYRLPGNGNTGVNIRSRVDRTGKRDFQAYHADLGHVGIGRQVLGAWDFHTPGRKEHACFRGDRLVIDENDKPRVTRIEGAVTTRDIRKNGWNHARVIAAGNNFKFYINGKLSSEFTEHLQPEHRLDKGMIQLQLHDPGMVVHFKDLRINVFK